MTPKLYTKCSCPVEHELLVQYERSLGPPYLDEYDYDGVSEYKCTKCQRRWGAWTNKELLGDEREKRYGGIK